MIELDGEMMRMLLQIVILFALGVHLLNNKDNAFSKAISQDEYDPKKVSTLFGVVCLGCSIASIPMLLDMIFQKDWLWILSVVSVLVIIIIAQIYVSNGKLK